MRRIGLFLALATIGLAVPVTTLGAPFPGNSERACDRAGGTFTVDTSTTPDTRTCYVDFNNGGVTLWYGLATGYVVEVSTSDDVAWYIAFTGHDEIFLGGAIAITDCWLNTVQVALTDPNCYPTTLIP
jgi:hypothetical protein